MKKAVITVIGNDRKGIIYHVTKVLYENGINILDLNQTIIQGFFNMVMIVDIGDISAKFEEVQDKLAAEGEELGLQIKIQHQDIFDAMYRI